MKQIPIPTDTQTNTYPLFSRVFYNHIQIINCSLHSFFLHQIKRLAKAQHDGAKNCTSRESDSPLLTLIMASFPLFKRSMYSKSAQSISPERKECYGKRLNNWVGDLISWDFRISFLWRSYVSTKQPVDIQIDNKTE